MVKEQEAEQNLLIDTLMLTSKKGVAKGPITQPLSENSNCSQYSYLLSFGLVFLVTTGIKLNIAPSGYVSVCLTGALKFSA